jgi:hypothetical protein
MLYMRIKFRLDLQADKSSVVVRRPFFSQVWTQGIESVKQMCDAKFYLLKLLIVKIRQPSYEFTLSIGTNPRGITSSRVHVGFGA